MTYRIKGKLSEFWKKLSEFEIKADDIIKTQNISKTESEKWVDQIIAFVSEKINPIPESIIEKFKYSHDEQADMFFQIGGFTDKTEEDIIRHRINQFKFKLNEFRKLRDYLSVINSLQDNKENVPIEINSIKEKLDFILEKLYILYGDNYYSVTILLETNNIETREDEPIEICNSLDKKGYIIREQTYSNKDSIKLSLKGAEYVERKKRLNKNKQKKKTNLKTNEKIDKVLKKLEELGFGQEIIFNEIEELRGLSKKLNKKTWSQVIKGKVMDLALSELISKDIATFIYESLVDEKIKLLK
ncbi:hypothetical protein ACFQ1R_14625 [Mariniflexile jejuense]|uniref:Uncharacterized protein n=1 Tax=Mariniflexile jejuense TaxID=1173582 RepID=A0ABW3JLV8_9FLAO